MRANCFAGTVQVVEVVVVHVVGTAAAAKVLGNKVPCSGAICACRFPAPESVWGADFSRFFFFF